MFLIIKERLGGGGAVFEVCFEKFANISLLHSISEHSSTDEETLALEIINFYVTSERHPSYQWRPMSVRDYLISFRMFSWRSM